MPAFLGPDQSQQAQPRVEASAPAPLTPEVVEPATRKPPTRRSRSSAVEARERLAEVQLPALNARVELAGLGDDPGKAARDESVRARLLTDLNVHGGLVAPQVSAQLVVHADLESALVDLERMLGVAE